MKNCTKCKHADWHKTAAGKLHPSGDGVCKYPWKLQKIPAAMCWAGRGEPKLTGGHINRRKELNDHCVYFEWDDTP